MNDNLEIHEKYMKMSLDIAREGLGRVAPNPSVGCIIVKNDKVIGLGRTSDSGRPHAETNALKEAGVNAVASTMYVTLEPCNNHGKTPPCVDAIINANIKTIVIATIDPDQRTSGQSIEKLKDAGIEVILGVLEEEALEQNKGFFLTIKEDRPLITLKCATTLDGKIATVTGHSKWITSERSREYVHYERSRHDAIMVGIGTIIKDDPLLTTRLEGVNHKIIRVIMDSDLRIPLNSKILKTISDSPVYIIHKSNSIIEAKQYTLQMMGVKLIEANNIEEAIKKLSKDNVTRLFVEGGTKIFTSFMNLKLCDRLLWFRSPKVIGGDGKNIFDSFGIYDMNDAIKFKRNDIKIFDEDILEILNMEKQECLQG